MAAQHAARNVLRLAGAAGASSGRVEDHWPGGDFFPLCISKYVPCARQAGGDEDRKRHDFSILAYASHLNASS
jgi:hypothetical protein